MNIVIVGAGEVGHHLAGILSRDGHAVSVVDPDPSKARRMMESIDVQAIVGDGTRADVLTQAGASKADLVVAVTDDDHVNMISCMLSQRLGAKRRILRLKDTSLLEGYRFFYKQALGFDVVLSTQELAAEEILSVVRGANALSIDTFVDGRVQLRRIMLREESELTSEPIQNMRLPAGVLIAAIARGKKFFVPNGEDHLLEDDQVYIIGEGSDCDGFERMAGAKTTWNRSVVIMGAGGIGRQIVRSLKGIPGISVRVIERDPARARALAAQASDDVMILEGDATDLSLLEEERISGANIFIATTGDDEDNMVACHLAKALGVGRTVAMVNKASYIKIYDLLALDRAISPRLLCAKSILRFVRSGSPSAIAIIDDGKAEVLELTAKFSEGRKVKSMNFPDKAKIGAVVNGDSVRIPTGDTVIEPGDHVIVLTLPEALEGVEKIFSDR